MIYVSTLGATGGGAHKYSDTLEHQLGITMKRFDELQCLVAGMQFVLRTVVGECYSYQPPLHNQEYSQLLLQRKKSQQLQQQQQDRQQNNDKRSPSSPLNEDYGNYVGVVENDRKEVSSSSTTTFGMDVDHAEEEEDEQGGEDVVSSSNTKQENDGNTTSAVDGLAAASAKCPAAPRPGKLDEWWWSRKVPRDAISEASTYPYLLVTIGTGVSIVRVDGPRRHERISGSTIGGGTYWGLIRLLTSFDNFSDVIRMAEQGDPSKVDMMVGDIYGPNHAESLEKLGLRADLVASSFGKLVAKENPAEGLREEDLARALLLMVTNNIGQVAYLNAQLHQTSRIYFVGNFLRQNKLSQRRLSFAIDYWSKGQMEALFLEHEGYFGALGAFLLSQEDCETSPFAPGGGGGGSGGEGPRRKSSSSTFSSSGGATETKRTRRNKARASHSFSSRLRNHHKTENGSSNGAKKKKNSQQDGGGGSDNRTRGLVSSSSSTASSSSSSSSTASSSYVSTPTGPEMITANAEELLSSSSSMLSPPPPSSSFMAETANAAGAMVPGLRRRFSSDRTRV